MLGSKRAGPLEQGWRDAATIACNYGRISRLLAAKRCRYKPVLWNRALFLKISRGILYIWQKTLLCLTNMLQLRPSTPAPTAQYHYRVKSAWQYGAFEPIAIEAWQPAVSGLGLINTLGNRERLDMTFFLLVNSVSWKQMTNRGK